MKTIAIIPSGGKGLRMGFNIPKEYVKVQGKEIIASTLKVFQISSKIDEIAVSAQEDYFELLNEIKSKYSITKLKYIVKGGETRQDSVYNALNKIEAGDNDLVAVHDAARPLLPISLLDSAIDFAWENNSVVVALQAKDTVIQGNNIVKDYLKRDEIYLAQTPQIFTYSIL
ncbi:MAG: 2-C-methyl-D-erythritol 4-phosphate cytidylyltransferase, partial [Ignavibacteria bacterium]